MIPLRHLLPLIRSYSTRSWCITGSQPILPPGPPCIATHGSSLNYWYVLLSFYSPSIPPSLPSHSLSLPPLSLSLSLPSPYMYLLFLLSLSFSFPLLHSLFSFYCIFVSLSLLLLSLLLPPLLLSITLFLSSFYLTYMYC